MTGTPLSLNQPGITRLIRYNLRDFYIELILELKRNKLPIVCPWSIGARRTVRNKHWPGLIHLQIYSVLIRMNSPNLSQTHQFGTNSVWRRKKKDFLNFLKSLLWVLASHHWSSMTDK